MLVLETSLRLSTVILGILAVTMLVEVESLLLADDEWDVEVVLASKRRTICIIDVAVIVPAVPRGWDSVEA